MTDAERLSKAAVIIADLLASTLDRNGRAPGELSCWEHDGLVWLVDAMSENGRCPPINSYTANRVRAFAAGQYVDYAQRYTVHK